MNSMKQRLFRDTAGLYIGRIFDEGDYPSDITYREMLSFSIRSPLALISSIVSHLLVLVRSVEEKSVNSCFPLKKEECLSQKKEKYIRRAGVEPATYGCLSLSFHLQSTALPTELSTAVGSSNRKL
ncbi:hypothetical protein AVEN_200292-1 [Araneus ventricosus]|uniref:Uncharacterized protein n=1 Tax=Araneus ventricosus TaxID=182803 RepID=A0A4Y2HHL8_ARAVE|nr:hypothetical protein AVEN_200292-1 [Araneus ventricosus]